jgi:histidine triad (HIT) family protein
MPSVFTKIINRELPAKVFHETDNVIVIADHRPRMPVHLLIIHKTEFPTFQETPTKVLGLLCDVAKDVAEKLGIPNHYQLHVNNGYGQEGDHIHLHFMSNRGLGRLQYIEDSKSEQ